MKKSFCVITIMTILGFCLVTSVGAVSESQKAAIFENCDKIKENLKTVQHQDSRARVYLGRYYETVLSKYIKPLNLRLVENSMIDSDLMDSQPSFAKMRSVFIDDYINYQKQLEELVSIDCRVDSKGFYTKLIIVRESRKVVESDTIKLKGLILNQLGLVRQLKEKL